MTIRQILDRLTKPSTPMRVRLMLGSVRMGLDAWKPGFLDKHVSVKIFPEQRRIVFTMDGADPYGFSFDEIEAYVETPTDGKPAANCGQSPVGSASVERDGGPG